MSDSEMTRFEASLERRMLRYAAITVRPVDTDAVAHDVLGARRRWNPFPIPTRPIEVLGGTFVKPRWLLPVLLGLLLLATLAAALYFGARLRNDQGPQVGRNGLIAYEASDGQLTHIRVMNPDGSGDTEILEGWHPVWSANGRKLAFWTSNMHLTVANPDGTNIHDIALYRRDYAFSPDGSQFALITESHDPRSRAPGGIWLVDVADGSERQLVEPPGAGLTYDNAVWAPDGRSLAYAVLQRLSSGDQVASYRSAINIVNVATGTVRRLTSRPGSNSADLAWAPDSSRLAFTGLPDGALLPSLESGISSFFQPDDVFAINADGTGETNLTRSATNDANPLWSGDGASLAYTIYSDETRHLGIIRMNGTHKTSEPTLLPLDAGVAWSPDGELLLVVSSTEVSEPNAETPLFRTTIQTIDAGLTQAPTTIATRDYLVGSFTWQWLAP